MTAGSVTWRIIPTCAAGGRGRKRCFSGLRTAEKTCRREHGALLARIDLHAGASRQAVSPHRIVGPSLLRGRLLARALANAVVRRAGNIGRGAESIFGKCPAQWLVGPVGDFIGGELGRRISEEEKRRILRQAVWPLRVA